MAEKTISVIVTCHGEGDFLRPTLASLRQAMTRAEDCGATVECIVVADRADAATLSVLETHAGRWSRRVEVDYGDPAQSRNRGVGEAQGEYISFLDGDDLWSTNWLTAALDVCAADQGRVVAHAEFNVVFGEKDHVWAHVDTSSPQFDLDYLRVANYWTALSFAHRGIYRAHPFRPNDPALGFGHEDWHWNCQTVGAGIAHRPAPGTVHFIRQRADSLSKAVVKRRAVIWETAVSAFSFGVNAT